MNSVLNVFETEMPSSHSVGDVTVGVTIDTLFGSSGERFDLESLRD